MYMVHIFASSINLVEESLTRAQKFYVRRVSESLVHTMFLDDTVPKFYTKYVIPCP